MSIGQQQSEEESNFSSRLRAAREMLALTQDELSKQWEISGNYVYMLEAGKKPIPKKLRKSIIELEQKVRSKLELSPSRLPSGKAPVVSWASAGRGGNFSDLAEFLDEFVDTDSSDPNTYALIVEGDSMQPEFKPGDRIVVAPNLEPMNGDEVVARLGKNGEVLFKVYHASGDKVVLTSYNPVFPPLEFSRSEFRFIHPVYQMIRKRKGRVRS